MDMDASKLGIEIEDRYLMMEAMSGDMAQAHSTPDAPAATTEAWSTTFTVTIQDEDGNPHKWLNGDFINALSVSDNSAAGTASLGSTTLSFVKGVATVTVNGDAAAWLEGDDVTVTVADLTILGYTVAGGDVVITVTV